jgi:hypothetical protein
MQIIAIRRSTERCAKIPGGIVRKKEESLKHICRNTCIGLLTCFLIAFSADYYSNPVFDVAGAADPDVEYYDGMYYIYATTDIKEMRVYWSPDMVNWSDDHNVLFTGQYLVAPDMFRDPADNTFYLYPSPHNYFYASSYPDKEFSRAGEIPKNPKGIDPFIFLDDDGKYYQYHSPKFKETWVQPLKNPTEYTSEADNTKLLSGQEQSWETSVNEGAFVIKHDGTYYLQYSSGGARNAQYAMGYATSKSPTGPFTKFEGNPILSRSDEEGIYGPGHHCLIQDTLGEYWCFYQQKDTHEWAWNRRVAMDRLWIDSTGVLHIRPSRGKQMHAPNNPFPVRDAFDVIQCGEYNGVGSTTLKFALQGTDSVVAYTPTPETESDLKYVAYRSLDFGSGAKKCEIEVAGSDGKGSISVRQDGVYGTELASLDYDATSSLLSSSIEPVAGVHHIVLVMSGKATTLKSIRFSEPAHSTDVSDVRRDNGRSERAVWRFDPRSSSQSSQMYTLRGRRIAPRRVRQHRGIMYRQSASEQNSVFIGKGLGLSE